MFDRRPQSPRSNELQFGLHHLTGRTVGSPLQQEWHNEDVQPLSQYTSPGLIHQSSDIFASDPYRDSSYPNIPSPAMGLGIDYAGQDSPMPGYIVAGQSFTGQSYMHVADKERSMTPLSQTSDGGRRTRSTRSATRSDSPRTGKTENSRVSKPSRTKKARSNKAFNNKMAKLEGPLSDLTKDMTVPVRDMEEWVNRSTETREQEVIKRNGYVTRPMNSFMLYRSTYAERTKQWCLQNNHQVVSSVSGESWPLEPEEVREHYRHLAKVERDNHARAHPSYKFSPSKTTAAKKKRGGGYSDEDEDDLSEPGDPDKEWTPRGERRSNGRSRRQGREVGFQTDNNFHQTFDPYQYEFDNGIGMNMGSWNAPNHHGRPLPTVTMQNDIYNQFYQPMAQTDMGPPTFQVGSHPDMYYDMTNRHDLFGPDSQTPMENETQVDPMLLQLYDVFGQEGTGNGGQLQEQLSPPNETDHLFGSEGPGQFEDWMGQR